jgi:hypothetical protein
VVDFSGLNQKEEEGIKVCGIEEYVKKQQSTKIIETVEELQLPADSEYHHDAPPLSIANLSLSIADHSLRHSSTDSNSQPYPPSHSQI